MDAHQPSKFERLTAAENRALRTDDALAEANDSRTNATPSQESAKESAA